MNQPTAPDDPSLSGPPNEQESPDAEKERTDNGTDREGPDAETAAEQPPDQPEEQPAARTAPVKTARGSGRAVAVLALLIALAAGAGSAYIYWTNQLATRQADSVRTDVAGDLATLSRKISDLAEKLRTTETDLAANRSRIDDFNKADAQAAARISALETRVADLAGRGAGPAPSDWRLAEVESLLRIANQQATLGRDARSALAALSAADSLLGRMSNPALQPVRSQVADEILALRSLTGPDTEGIALRLDSLARRVDSLPLAGHREHGTAPSAAAEPEGGLARFRARVIEFFSSIFRVRSAEGPAEPLLAPEESFFLRRNLELELQSARLALLQGDAAVYRASIASARRWTEAYFRADDPGVQAFERALGELETRRIDVELPDISGSLKTLLSLETDAAP